MNAKEEVLEMLKKELEQAQMKMPYKYQRVEYLKHLITAVENAIFDVPSYDEELFKELWYKRNPCHDINTNTQKDMFYETAFCVFIDFINYKKPETDE